MAWQDDHEELFGPVVPVYQPIVDLRSDAVVGYEALARWPARPKASPEAVLADARRRGLILEVDEMCAVAAVGKAIGTRPDGQLTLFLNVEADGIASGQSTAAARRISELLGANGSRMRLVAEFAERSLLDDPGRLLRAADYLRRMGNVIALDDVGAVPDSLVLLPLLAPEIIKLDRSLLQHDLREESLATLLAVLSYANRFDVALIAEGIESEMHMERALAWGAAYGQGYYLGKPGPMRPEPVVNLPVHVRSRPGESFRDILETQSRDTADLLLLDSLTKQLLDFASTTTELLTIVVAFDRPDLCTDHIARRLCDLARRHPYVKVIGANPAPFTSSLVRRAERNPDDSDGSCIAVIGQRFYCALAGRPIETESFSSAWERWTYFLTVDPTLVCTTAHTLIVNCRSATSSQPTPSRTW